MAEQTNLEQETQFSEESTSFHETEDHEHEDYIPEFELPRGIWEELGMEIHELVDKLVSKLQKTMHIENLLQEKPKDIEDKSAISTWLDKLINLVKNDSEETEDDTISCTSRGFDNDDAVAKLERFKVKNLAGGSTTVKEEKKK
uniref:Uncharacterized protein n=1 Tax=Chenopodium quinoa TaxID=63459 RepID=A0A803NAS5_CHEQI